MLTKHLVKNNGKKRKNGRSSKVIMTTEAKVLCDLRQKAGLSMRKAASLLGVSDSFISHIENGRCATPKGNKLQKFLAVYGGIKEKSFYEKVRIFKERLSERDKVLDLIKNAPENRMSQIADLITVILQSNHP